MHSFVTSKNVKWCHLIWPTLYICRSTILVHSFLPPLFDLLITIKGLAGTVSRRIFLYLWTQIGIFKTLKSKVEQEYCKTGYFKLDKNSYHCPVLLQRRFHIHESSHKVVDNRCTEMMCEHVGGIVNHWPQSVLLSCRSLCYSLSPSTQFIEKLLHSNVAKLFSESERQDLCVPMDTASSPTVPLRTAFAFPLPGWSLFMCSLYVTYEYTF